MKKTNEKPYEIFEVPFGSAMEFIQTFLDNGEYFIPANGTLSSKATTTINDTTKEYLNKYDPYCIKVFQRQDNTLALKNIKALNGDDPSNQGYLQKVGEIIDKIDSVVCKPGVKSIISVINSSVTKHKNKIPSIFVWFPVWNPNNEMGTMITLFDKITLLFT